MNSSLKNRIRSFLFFLSQFGINILKFRNIFYILSFFKDLFKFIKLGGKFDRILPIFGEHKLNSGNLMPHYFYQDLIVANYIFTKNPAKHVDIGSRVDGFIANVASFREVEIFDIRENDINFKNIKFNKIDILKINKTYFNYADSLSCLHVIEHFGLGRYGDEIDPQAHIIAFRKILQILKSSGILYISFPICTNGKIFFNMERRFDPNEIFEWSKDFDLIKFDFIDDQEQIFLNYDLKKINDKKIENGCGIYTLIKK